MSGSKHTPGPWEARVEEQHYVTSGEGRIANALFPRYAADGSEVMANALLIAAAPELLEIVETFDAYMGQAGEEAEQDSLNPVRALRWKAQQAIAKVTGGAA